VIFNVVIQPHDTAKLRIPRALLLALTRPAYLTLL
jgi:hypothetical protein